jgi:hypothetical protein
MGRVVIGLKPPPEKIPAQALRRTLPKQRLGWNENAKTRADGNPGGRVMTLADA